MFLKPAIASFVRSPAYRHSSYRHILRNNAHIARPGSQLRPQSTASAPYIAIPDPPPPIKRGVFRFTGAVLLYALLGIAMAAAPHIANGNMKFSPPTDAETLTLFNPEPGTDAAEVEQYMQQHPFVESLYQDKTLFPSRPHLKIPPALRPLSLTGGTLMGDNKIVVPPLAFTTHDGSRYISIQYLGSGLSGHPGMVHGGMLATLLDEGLARCCIPALPAKVGVTASLKIDYKRPTPAEGYIVLRAKTTKVEGRKAWVTGWIETLPSPADYEAGLLKADLNGVINGNANGSAEGAADGHAKKGQATPGAPVRLVEAEALFVEPKNASTMMRVFSSQSDSAVASARNSPPPQG